MNTKKIAVVELFAGVGGFRIALEKSSKRYKTIWANQWEPNKKKQHAFDCYIEHYGESISHVNQDISLVKSKIPKHDLLVGGFPCQDYSVARSGAKGIEGHKGVLWWEIRDIIENNNPKYILLENVDRLLKSPSHQRGRDFGIILKCLNDLGYAVEWRVINAADYGNPQRRRRIFILASNKSTSLYNKLIKNKKDKELILLKNGFFAKNFPVTSIFNKKKYTNSDISSNTFNDLIDVSNNFKENFFNSGVMIEGKITSIELQPIIDEIKTLGSILEKNAIDNKYFLSSNTEKWEFLKGAKRILRTKPNGEKYFFSEGAMCFPDNLSIPSRTMLTSESSVNRSSHVVKDLITNNLRVLTPNECERLNGFPDDWTNTGMPHKFRYFVMGNALVVPIVERIGASLVQYF